MQKKVDDKGISAFSFMVEVIQAPKSEKQFIVRVQSNMGMSVACFGNYKEFVQFIDSL